MAKFALYFPVCAIDLNVFIFEKSYALTTKYVSSFSVREVLKLLHGELVDPAEALYDKLAINPGSIPHLRPYITPIVF